jgi:hypothetical protein
MVPESALNRYRVWPCESTRIRPRLLLATRSIPAWPVPVVVTLGVEVRWLPPPQPATVSTLSAIGVRAVRKVIRLPRFMIAPVVE